eukprot:scaffold141868_cov47-Prasinocladus_malaysianus.AAC.1
MAGRHAVSPGPHGVPEDGFRCSHGVCGSPKRAGTDVVEMETFRPQLLLAGHNCILDIARQHQRSGRHVPVQMARDAFPGSPLLGRPLYALTSSLLAFVFYAISLTGDIGLARFSAVERPPRTEQRTKPPFSDIPTGAGDGTCGDVLAAAVIFTWLRMLYFIRLLRGFGSFCIILVEMIKRDVTKFCLLLAG